MTKILLIDDSDFERKIAKQALEELDFEIVEANNFDSAVKAFKKGEFKIALIDILMEGKDGIEILQKLKSIDSNLKIVLMSSLDEEEVKELVKSNNAQGYLIKPYSTIKLRSIIEEIL